MYVSVSVRTFLLWVPENSAPSGISIVGSGARGVQGGKVVFRQGRLWALRGYHSGPGFSPSLNSVSFCDNSIFRLAYLMWPHNGGHTFDPHPWRCQSRKREAPPMMSPFLGGPDWIRVCGWPDHWNTGMQNSCQPNVVLATLERAEFSKESMGVLQKEGMMESGWSKDNKYWPQYGYFIFSTLEKNYFVILRLLWSAIESFIL